MMMVESWEGWEEEIRENTQPTRKLSLGAWKLKAGGKVSSTFTGLGEKGSLQTIPRQLRKTLPPPPIVRWFWL